MGKDVTAYSRTAMQERAELNRRKRKESLRKALKPHGYLTSIHAQLNRDFEKESTITALDRDGNEVQKIDREAMKCRILEAKFKTDQWMRLLSKSLPDLKAVEHTTAPAETSMTADELASNIIDAERRLRDAGFGGGAPLIATPEKRATETETPKAH